ALRRNLRAAIHRGEPVLCSSRTKSFHRRRRPTSPRDCLWTELLTDPARTVDTLGRPPGGSAGDAGAGAGPATAADPPEPSLFAEPGLDAEAPRRGLLDPDRQPHHRQVRAQPADMDRRLAAGAMADMDGL